MPEVCHLSPAPALPIGTAAAGAGRAFDMTDRYEAQLRMRDEPGHESRHR